jgi:uncharacterized phage protein gp47/JayE
MFEARTYDQLMKEVLAQAPSGIDTRKGSIFYDAVAAVVNKIAKLYTDLDCVFDLVFIATTHGDYLDLRASEYGLSRQSATPTKYNFTYTGTKPQVGWRFFHNSSGLYFVLQAASDGTLYLEAETSGLDCDDIQDGDIAVPVDTVVGMTSANFAGIYEYGTDVEDDDSLRMRIMEKIAGPAENGNKQHYKTWCESVTGVGLARIEPLWNGENTVRAVLISPLGIPVQESIVAEVQAYVDPADLGLTAQIDGKTYVVGDGLGNGVANIGAHFTAVAAEPLKVDITFGAELTSGRTEEELLEAATTAITEYLQNLVINATDGATVVVRLSSIGAILAGLTDYLVDYRELTLNGSTENIQVANNEVPVLGEVTVDVVS